MILGSSPRRLGIFFFFDAEGIVDRYVETLLADMCRNVERLVIVVNGELATASRRKLAAFSDQIMVRDNVGLDVWAYKHAIDALGWEVLVGYDEIVLFNATIMGPVYPFAEMFDAMAERDVDFWGPTVFHKIDGDPFGTSPYGYIPEHLQSHFHVYRRSLVASQAFQSYWNEMPMIHSYLESVGIHEVSFTKRFADLGFRWEAYVDTSDMEGMTYQPIIFEPTTLIRDRRCPIFKRRTFFHEYEDVLEQSVGNAASDLYAYLHDQTDYDTSQIWDNMLRTVDLATLVRNLKLTYVLPSEVSLPGESGQDMRIALVMHVYYMELLPQLLEYARAMPENADLIITVGSDEKARQAEKLLAALPQRTIIRVIENRGRDVAALLVGVGRDILDYDLVCFIHDKKVTQVHPGTVGEGFALKGYENVLATADYVRNVVTTFAHEPRMGVMMPPPPNHGAYFPIYSDTWGPNYRSAKRLLADLGVSVPIRRDHEVIAPLGSIFWFRPQAVRALFEFGWQWDDFPPEPLPQDGTISHAIERSYCYVAQAAGYYSAWVLSDSFARLELTNLAFYTRELTRAIAQRHGAAPNEREMVARIQPNASARQIVKAAVGRRIPQVALPAARAVYRTARKVRRAVR